MYFNKMLHVTFQGLLSIQLQSSFTPEASGNVHGRMLSLCNTEGTSLTEKMKNVLETHSQQFTALWEGFMGRLEVYVHNIPLSTSN